MVCRECKKDLSEDRFEVQRIGNKSYRRLKCKRCKQDIQNQRLREIRKWITEYKKKQICSDCGLDDYRVLQFHHIDPSDKVLEISNATSKSWSIARIKTEIDKCITLCANCHAIRHYPKEKYI